jgi:hypothetical protein
MSYQSVATQIKKRNEMKEEIIDFVRTHAPVDIEDVVKEYKEAVDDAPLLQITQLKRLISVLIKEGSLALNGSLKLVIPSNTDDDPMFVEEADEEDFSCTLALKHWQLNVNEEAGSIKVELERLDNRTANGTLTFTKNGTVVVGATLLD